MDKGLEDILTTATTCYQNGHFSDARNLFLSALDMNDANKAALLSNISVVAFAMNDFEDAVKFAQEALSLDDNFAQAHYNLANALSAIGKHDESLNSYEKAITLDEIFFDAHYNKANLLSDLGQYENSIRAYAKAIRCNPASDKAYTNMAISCAKINMDDKAFELYAKALELNQSSESLWLNIALLLQANKEYEKAKLCLQNAISINPNYAEAIWSLSLLHLTLKEFESGWALYEERFNPNLREKLALPHIDKPRALKPDINKTILVMSEQGFGDAVMFCRFLPLLAQKYAKVIFQPPKELFRLMACSKIISKDIQIVENIEDNGFDEFTTICSLPHLLSLFSDNMPFRDGYFDAPKSGKFDYLKNDKKIKIGLVWQGSVHIQRLDKKRSIELKSLSKLLNIQNLSFYALQKGYGIEQVGQNNLNEKITILSDKFDDFADTAEAISMLDIVITVDTSVAHISAALGKPTWILIDMNNCFRWGANEEKSYWYSLVELFRQEIRGDWTGVVNSIAKKLEKYSQDRQGKNG